MPPPALPAAPTALPQGTERFDGMEAALELGSALLSAERRHLWHLLAVFPGSFDSAAAAAVWTMEPEAGRVELELLVRSSLVDWEDLEGRYRLHDLARSFAARSLAEAERDAGQRRLAEHFLRVLAEVETLYLQGGDSIQAALQTFDAEWGNFQTGQAWAARHLRDGDAVARLCSDYVEAGTFILALRLNVRDLIEWRTLGLEAARQRNDKAAEGRHLGALGLLAASLGEPRRAIEFHEQDLALAREIGDRGAEGTILGNLGIAYAELGETRRSIELYEQALTIAREIGDRRGESNALGNLGNAHLYLGEARRAIELYEQHLALARAFGDQLAEGSTLGNLGRAYLDLGESRRAVELYQQQLAIAREIGDRSGEATASWNCGLAYEAAGNLGGAVDLMQVQVDYKREIGHSNAEPYAAYLEALRRRLREEPA